MDKDFAKAFYELCYGKNPYDVWVDFVTLSAISIANTLDYQEEREKLAKDIIKKYKKQDISLIAKLLAYTTKALEDNPAQDYLGKLFMELNFGNRDQGQIFTPYHIAEEMAALVFEEANPNPYLTVNDPACGAGVMLIAVFNQMRKRKQNPHLQLFCVGQDISFPIAMMCYIQMSLLGIAGYVLIENSLTAPPNEHILTAPDGAWCTPLYYNKIWQIRRSISN